MQPSCGGSNEKADELKDSSSSYFVRKEGERIASVSKKVKNGATVLLVAGGILGSVYIALFVWICKERVSEI